MRSLYTEAEKQHHLALWRRESGLSGNGLKCIACICMFFDHLSQGVALRSIGFTPTYTAGTWGMPILSGLSAPALLATAATLIGRIAFPIFCFFLVQGLLLSRDYRKQIRRLLIFALIAEVPFDLGLNGTFFYWNHQNVLFTLALGAATVAAVKKTLDAGGRWKRVQAIGIFAAAAFVSEMLKFDYGAAGIIAMILFYLTSTDRKKTVLAGIIAFFFEAPLYGTVYLSLPLIDRYNGRRGRGGRWGFYLFYPAHLLALYLLSLIL